MYIVAALLSIIFASDNTIYIVTDNGPQSQIIKHEMTRDWFKNVEQPYSPVIQDIAEIQCQLQHSVIIVDYYDYKLCNKYRIPRFNKYPQYRISEYKDFKEFPLKTFNASSIPLMTINTIKNNADVNESEWTEKCEALKKEATYAHIQKIISWGQENNLEDINDVYYFYEGDEEITFENIIKKYKDKKGYPEFKPAILPESPMLKFPWERNADLFLKKPLDKRR